MTDIEKRRMALQLRAVESARMELEIKIDEAYLEIERLKKHIEVQIAKETELKGKLGE